MNHKSAMDKFVHIVMYSAYTRHWFTSNEELNASDCLYFFLKLVALLHEVWCIPVQDVHIGRVNVNVVEEVLEHVGVVALGVVPGDAHILVHVKCDNMLEGQLTRLAEFN